MKLRKFILVTCLLSLVALPAKAEAARFLFESREQIFKQDREFLLNVFMSPQGEPINAIEGKIVFPKELLTAREVRDGNSIVNFWVERPGTAKSGEINFSGIIPGGYDASRGFLFSIVLRANKIGSGEITMVGAKALKDDGLGTAASVGVSPFKFSIVEPDNVTAPETVVEPIQDTMLPEAFIPIISRSPDLFDNKWFVVFATQDKDSGISHYEVKEGEGPYNEAQSPYLLKDQTLSSEVFVKAVDKSQNEQIAKAVKPKLFSTYIIAVISGIIILIVVLLAILAFRLWKRKSL